MQSALSGCEGSIPSTTFATIFSPHVLWFGDAVGTGCYICRKPNYQGFESLRLRQNK